MRSSKGRPEPSSVQNGASYEAELMSNSGTLEGFSVRGYSQNTHPSMDLRWVCAWESSMPGHICAGEDLVPALSLP